MSRSAHRGRTNTARVEAAAEHAAQGDGQAREAPQPRSCTVPADLGLVLVLIVLAIIGTATSDNFLTSDNMRNIWSARRSSASSRSG